jgi:hypothetical protein
MARAADSSFRSRAAPATRRGLFARQAVDAVAQHVARGFNDLESKALFAKLAFRSASFCRSDEIRQM